MHGLREVVDGSDQPGVRSGFLLSLRCEYKGRGRTQTACSCWLCHVSSGIRQRANSALFDCRGIGWLFWLVATCTTMVASRGLHGCAGGVCRLTEPFSLVCGHGRGLVSHNALLGQGESGGNKYLGKVHTALDCYCLRNPPAVADLAAQLNQQIRPVRCGKVHLKNMGSFVEPVSCRGNKYAFSCHRPK